MSLSLGSMKSKSQNMFLKLTPLIFFAFVTVIATSCNANSNEEEKVQISTMDSTSKALKDNKAKLEEQTKKVEASLEKLDTEFDTTNKNN